MYYFLTALIVFAVLYSMAQDKTNIQSIGMSTIAIVVLLMLLDRFLIPRAEGMDPLISGCPDREVKMPDQYLYTTGEEDHLKTYQDNNYNLPGYYLINNGKYSEKGIDYSKVADLICSSKLHDLISQHNYNIIWSPHTHIGKARGYLNWDKIYP